MYFTDRLMFRPFDPEADTKTVLRWLNDPDMVGALSPPGPTFPSSRNKAKKLVENLADKEDKLPCLAICKKPSGDESLGADDDYFLTGDKRPRYPAIGLLSISSARGYSHFNRSVMLGIGLDTDHRNGGLGTEALRWAVKYCFEDLNMHRIELGAGSTNARALHVYEKKLGFVREGVRRKNAWRDGGWRDTVDLALLEEEWAETSRNHGRKLRVS